MDHGRLFSRGRANPDRAGVVYAAPDWTTAPPVGQPSAREVEWFAVNGVVYRRDRTGLASQALTKTGEAIRSRQVAFLGERDVHDLTTRLAPGCGAPSVLADNDDYPAHSVVPERPSIAPDAATSGSTSTVPTAACCKDWMPRGAPIAGSIARFTRSIFPFSWRIRVCAISWSSGSACWGWHFPSPASSSAGGACGRPSRLELRIEQIICAMQIAGCAGDGRRG